MARICSKNNSCHILFSMLALYPNNTYHYSRVSVLVISYRMRPRKTQRSNKKKQEERPIKLSTKPLLPGHLSVCHPRFDGTRRRTRCLPVRYHTIVKIPKRGCNKEDGAAEISYTHKERDALKSSTAISEEEKRDLLKNYFRPEMPAEWFKDPDAWLSSVDIEDVMRQYEVAERSFKFLGVVPIDFSSPASGEAGPTIDRVGGTGPGSAPKCLAEEYCNVDLKAERARDIRTIGCVFNLDPSTKGGSHWVASAIILKPAGGGSIYYFDSYGEPPPAQVAHFMRALKLQDPALELKYNGRRFQYGGSECGMYSMYFVICMINRVPFPKFVRHTVADKYMLELRKILFS